MKKILTTIFILIIGLTLVSCNRTEDKTLAKVYYYEFRNSFTTNKYNPDVVKSETFEVGKLISVPNEPFRPGHDFDGWYKDITYQEEWDFENDTLDKNIVLYAKWTNPTYKVNLNFNGGWFPSNTRYDGVYDEETDSYYYEYRTGTSQTLHSAIRTGYDFKGWHETNDYKQGDKRLTQVNRDLAEDTTYFAHWTLKRITVTFDVNLASAFPDKVDRTVVDYGSLINFPQLSDNFGIYEFIGWNTRRDGSGDYLRNGQEFNREVTTTLYAQWREL